MARRKTNFIEGNYYHIYNRGCNRENIFRSEDNYLFLIEKLKKYSIELHVSVIAYCLMPNHYHFLVKQNGNIEAGLLPQNIFNGYTKAFNNSFERSGTLFEGPYKSIHVDKTEYVVHLCRYIHRNPFDAKIVKDIEDWKFSNYLECVGKRKGVIFEKEFMIDHFGSVEGYEKFVLEYQVDSETKKAIEHYMLQ